MNLHSLYHLLKLFLNFSLVGILTNYFCTDYTKIDCKLNDETRDKTLLYRQHT